MQTLLCFLAQSVQTGVRTDIAAKISKIPASVNLNDYGRAFGSHLVVVALDGHIRVNFITFGDALAGYFIFGISAFSDFVQFAFRQLIFLGYFCLLYTSNCNAPRKGIF